jgi:hypothetical protein
MLASVMTKILSIWACFALTCVLFATGCGEVKTSARLESGSSEKTAFSGESPVL